MLDQLDQLISDLLMFLRWMLPPAGWTENNSYSDDDQKYLQCCWCKIQSLICLSGGLWLIQGPRHTDRAAASLDFSFCLFFLLATCKMCLTSNEPIRALIRHMTSSFRCSQKKNGTCGFQTLCDKLIDLRSPLIR